MKNFKIRNNEQKDNKSHNSNKRRLRFLKNRKAQSTVEFALCFPFFFMLIFGVVDFSRYAFQKQTMKRILQRTARFAMTGARVTGAEESRPQSIKIAAEKFNPTPGSISIDIMPDPDMTQEPPPTDKEIADEKEKYSMSLTPWTGGQPEAKLTITLKSNFSFITPFVGHMLSNGEGGYVMREWITVYNEKYSLNNYEIRTFN